MTGKMEKAKGRLSVLLGATVLCLLVVWALVWLAILAATGQFWNRYAQVRVSPKDVLWLQFKGNRMRTAPAPAMLEQSSWVKPQYRGWGVTEFPAVDLPMSERLRQEGWGGARVYFTLHGRYCKADWRLSQTDDTSARWEFQVTKDLEVSRSPDKAAVNELPRVGRPMLGVDARPGREEGAHTVGVALTLRTDQGDSLDVAKNGRNVDAQVRVLDTEGKVVASKKAPLKEFGYT